MPYVSHGLTGSYTQGERGFKYNTSRKEVLIPLSFKISYYFTNMLDCFIYFKLFSYIPYYSDRAVKGANVPQPKGVNLPQAQNINILTIYSYMCFVCLHLKLGKVA